MPTRPPRGRRGQGALTGTTYKTLLLVSPYIGPESQNVRSLCFCGLCGPYLGGHPEPRHCGVGQEPQELPTLRSRDSKLWPWHHTLDLVILAWSQQAPWQSVGVHRNGFWEEYTGPAVLALSKAASTSV